MIIHLQRCEVLSFHELRVILCINSMFNSQRYSSRFVIDGPHVMKANNIVSRNCRSEGKGSSSNVVSLDQNFLDWIGDL